MEKLPSSLDRSPKLGADNLTVNGELAGDKLLIQGGTTLLNAPTRLTGFTTITGGTLVIGHPEALRYSTVSPAPGCNFPRGSALPPSVGWTETRISR